jgi:uncharacterized protein YecE (DUF72 family)
MAGCGWRATTPSSGRWPTTACGVTAWTEPSLAESGALYPPGVATAEERLRYYAARFPVTEVDASFYRPLAERTAALWAARTPPGLLFGVKAFRLLTATGAR